MLYLAYQTHADIMVPVRIFAEAGLNALAPWAAAEDLKVLRNLTAAYELITRAGLTHERPPYGIDSVRVGNREVAVHEEALDVTPFGTLLRFKKDVDIAQPQVLVVAPLSGHFATLLRSLVRTMLPDHDVCITDWHNARDVGIDEGRFGFDDYVSHLIGWLEVLGSRRACRRRLPALRAGAHGRGSHGPDRQPCPAAQHDADGGPDRHAHQPDQGQRAGHEQADRVVRAEPDRARAHALPRRRAQGLSGLRAALPPSCP